MKKKHLQPLTPAALFARVSSDRQDVDLSVSAQLRALKDYARANGYSVAREYVDEAESGRVADRPQFREMIEEGGKPNAPFEVILVWKFSRFTRKREHAVAFKSMLRRKGIRVVSITERADDSPTGKLMEAIIESVDEFYSENLAEDVTRGMREAASRGFFLGSKAPFGYRRVKVSDGMKERPTLEVDPATAPVVKEIFESSLSGYGLKEICRTLNDRGITNRGKRWSKGGLHYLLTNEAYTGTSVWGRTTKVEKAQDPVRVEGAWPALVSRELFDAVQEAMRDRAPKVRRPARVGSRFLLSGLLKCGVCGRPYSGQGAKSGQFAYYICGTLFREGAGTCSARYLNASRVEEFVVEKIRERILTEETIVELVTLVAEEIDVKGGVILGPVVLLFSISVTGNCSARMSHYGECDVEPKGTGKVSGSQQLAGGAYDDRAGIYADGSEHTPCLAHSGGIQEGRGSRPGSRSSRSQSAQRDIGGNEGRCAASGTHTVRGNQPHTYERVVERTRRHRHNSQHATASAGERRRE